MKKIFAILLLLIHTVANTGVAARIDYCGDAVRSVSISFDKELTSEKCICPADDTWSMDCCSSTEVLLKADTEGIQTQKAGLDIWMLGALLPILFGNLFPLLFKKQLLTYAVKQVPLYEYRRFIRLGALLI